MTENPFYSISDEELRNVAVYFYGLPDDVVPTPLFDVFEKELADRFSAMARPNAMIPPERALLYCDLMQMAAENASDFVVDAAVAAQDNVLNALDKAIVPDLELTDEDIDRNETDLRVYEAEDPFEIDEDGEYVYPAFERLDNAISAISLVDDDEREEDPDAAHDEITEALRISAAARLHPVLMHSREKIDEDAYFSMLYDQMVWDVAGMFLSDAALSEEEAERNAMDFLKECGWGEKG